MVSYFIIIYRHWLKSLILWFSKVIGNLDFHHKNCLVSAINVYSYMERDIPIILDILFTRSRLPPGMLKEYKSRYPWFTEEHYIKPRTRLANHQRRLRHKSLIPKVVRLADPFEAPRPITFVPALDRSPKRIIRSRKCHCGLSHSKRICCHERVLKFFRKREISYLSSSDDEVFPHISKKRKKCKKRSNTWHREDTCHFTHCFYRFVICCS